MNQEVNTHARTNRHQSGFTIIELLLAMTFISVLLLTIALTIVQIANIYNRGMILKEVNQASRSISDELSAAMRGNSAFSTKESAQRYVEKDWGGRMCLGQYSYIWNYGSTLDSDNSDYSNRNKYASDNTAGNNEISLVKAPDAGGIYCVRGATDELYPDVDPEGAVELLRSGDHSLAVHSLAIEASSTDALSSQQLYRISFTLGTNRLTAMTDDQSACKPPGEPNSDLNYCVVQQFTLVIRVVSGVN